MTCCHLYVLNVRIEFMCCQSKYYIEVLNDVPLIADLYFILNQ